MSTVGWEHGMPFCCSWNYTNLTSPILLNIKFLVLSLMFYKSQWCPLWSFLLSFCGLCQADTMPSTSVNTSQHVLLLNSLWFRCFWKKWTISLKLTCRTWRSPLSSHLYVSPRCLQSTMNSTEHICIFLFSIPESGCPGVEKYPWCPSLPCRQGHPFGSSLPFPAHDSLF